MKNILILGSEGQIGHPLKKHLLTNHNCYGFDLHRNSQEDLRTWIAIDRVIEKQNIDFVFFLAFDVGGSTYLAKHQQTKVFLDNNMRIMLNTFESLERFKTPFIFASSQMSNMTHSPYGLLKAIGEQYTRTLGGLTVKFWNVYGVEHDPEKTHVITDFIRMAKAGRITMRTDGTEQRQFLHAQDCCEALDAVMCRYNQIPRDMPIHITSFAWISVLTIASIICDMAKVPITVPGKKDDLQRNQRNEPDRSILHYWMPKISINEGIKKVWDAMA